MTNEEAIRHIRDILAENNSIKPSMVVFELEKEALYMAIKALDSRSNTWSLEDAREDFMYDVYNTLDFLPTNNEANRIIDIFDRVTSSIRQEPCEDCISREVALDTISELNAISFYEAQEDSKECYYEIRDAIKQLPPAASHPKIGQWIVNYPDGARAFKCNQCNKYADIHHATDYCPNCGARMAESEAAK